VFNVVYEYAKSLFYEYVLIPIEMDEGHACIINLSMPGVFM